MIISDLKKLNKNYDALKFKSLPRAKTRLDLDHATIDKRIRDVEADILVLDGLLDAGANRDKDWNTFARAEVADLEHRYRSCYATLCEYVHPAYTRFLV